ncbi:MAG: hypothetical protein K0U82_23005, partial [Planctomycetes bacterium]|nr:hypothetical protein [Planctomycetota bacterium]
MCHAQATYARGSQRTRVAVRVRRVVHVQTVGVAFTINCKNRRDPVHVAARRRGQAANVHCVSIGTS